MKQILGGVLVLTLVAPGVLLAQSGAWKPARAVELVVGVAPGGSIDRTARDVQRIVQNKRLLPTGMVVMNKPGGGHALAFAYLSRFAGDGHYLQLVNTPFLTNRILGRSQINYKDFTPIAVLFDETQGFAVKADSPIRNGRDFVEQLRKDPAALSISISTGVGTVNHLSVAMVAKSLGIDSRKLKTVVFNSSSEGVLATVGGHVDVVVTNLYVILPLVEAGKLRFIALSSEKRMPGPFAQVPTWREQGVDAVVAAWRAVVAPPSLAPAQIAYWDDVFSKVTAADEWRDQLKANYLSASYLDSRQTGAFFDAEYEKCKSLLSDSGMLK